MMHHDHYHQNIKRSIYVVKINQIKMTHDYRQNQCPKYCQNIKNDATSVSKY